MGQNLCSATCQSFNDYPYKYQSDSSSVMSASLTASGSRESRVSPSDDNSAPEMRKQTQNISQSKSLEFFDLKDNMIMERSRSKSRGSFEVQSPFSLAVKMKMSYALEQDDWPSEGRQYDL